jgi:hypothetical protein
MVFSERTRGQNVYSLNIVSGPTGPHHAIYNEWCGGRPPNHFGIEQGRDFGYPAPEGQYTSFYLGSYKPRFRIRTPDFLIASPRRLNIASAGLITAAGLGVFLYFRRARSAASEQGGS